MHQQVEPNIRFIRMITGEDVLAEFVTRQSTTGNSSKMHDFHYLVNPLKVVYGMTPKQDGMIITLGQWVFDTICDNQEFNIKMEDVLLIGNPTKEMIEYYNEAIERNKSPRKLRTIARREPEEEEFEEISDGEMEMLKSVLDGMKEAKKRLH
jgi:hypothetical protein